jgi:hypothetical protein
MPEVTEADQFHKIYALMRFERDDLVQWLATHLGYGGNDGSYLYHLTRCKSAFGIGTVTVQDFEEVDYSFVEEIADMLLEKLRSYDS